MGILFFNIYEIKISTCWLITLIIVISLYISKSDTYCQQIQLKDSGVRTIYLIRHGEYNHDDKRDPFIGKGLVPLGIAQTRLVAARLNVFPDRMSSLISSTMTRALQTAMIINEKFPDLKLQQSELICECTPPTWREDIMANENPDDILDCTNNLDLAFQRFFIPSPDSNERNDIIVCHGNVIRYFVTKVMKVDPMSWLQMSIGNCSITIVKIMPDGSMKLAAFSDTGHIPPSLSTETGGENETKALKFPEEKE